MNDYDELERYRRLLEEWQTGGKGPARGPGKPTPPSSGATSRPSVTPAPAPAGNEPYARGAILDVGGQFLAVYQRPLPDKGCHLVLMLCPNGTVRAQGVILDGQKVEELGALPQPYLDRLQNEVRWNRDLIVFHCYRFEDTARIPHPEAPNGGAVAASAASPRRDEASGAASPAPTAVANGTLRRGQRLRINFGKNSWEAVYWGRDAQGQVVAHKTYEKWALMHLDLERFKNSMAVEPEVDPNLVREIEESLTA